MIAIDMALRSLRLSSEGGLLGVAVTVGAYGFGIWVRRCCRGAAAANPVLISICIVIGLLQVSRIDYGTYLRSVGLITFLLGPTIVALAVPFTSNIDRIGRNLPGLALALLAGSLTAIISGSLIVWSLGGARNVVLSMALKAATTPIAMAVASAVGGIPALTATLAVSGGVVAAVVGPPLLRWLKVIDPRARGLAAGVAGSGVATAEIAHLGNAAAAFAVVGLGLNGLLTAFLVPMLATIWAGQT